MPRGRTRAATAAPMRVDDALDVADRSTLTGGAQDRALVALAAYVRAARTGYATRPVRWDAVEAGAVFVGARGLWCVDEAPKDRADRVAHIRSGDERHEVPVRPGDTIDVLIPLVEAVALRLAVAELGAVPMAAAS